MSRLSEVLLVFTECIRFMRAGMIRDFNVAFANVTLLSLICLGCGETDADTLRLRSLKQQLADSQSELTILQQDLVELSRWKIRQQKTVTDYSKILNRQGVTDLSDNAEWLKRKQRADQYSRACDALLLRIEKLQTDTIPELKGTFE